MSRIVRRRLGALQLRTWRFQAEPLIAAHQRMLGRQGLASLIEVMKAFALSPEVTGRLFHCSRQAINIWLKKGVPAERIASVERVAALAHRLVGTFVPSRLPSIVRESMPGLQGKTILETIATDGIGPVDEMLERARSYVPAR